MKHITLSVTEETFRRFSMFRAMKGLQVGDISENIIKIYLDTIETLDKNQNTNNQTRVSA